MAYDPAFAYELAAIVRHGLHRMHGNDPVDVFYYLTLYNENHVMPARPDGVSDDDIVAGIYRWRAARGTPDATILFSGSAHGAATEAADHLRDTWGVEAELWSVTSWKSLRDDAMEVERWNRLHPDGPARASIVGRALVGRDAPVVAVTDWMRIVADQVAPHVPGRPFTALGTDGMGRSGTRAALRRHFETDAGHVVVAVLRAMMGRRGITADTVRRAMEAWNIDPDAPHGLSRD